MKRLTSALLPGLLLTGVFATAAAPARSAIDTSQPGVVCDASEQLCYDREGLALPATRRAFGRYGEDKARRLIERGERGRTFLLSNGSACDVKARTCWDDGWKRRNVSTNLSRHLFGSSGSQGGNDPWNSNDGSHSAECLLRRAGRTIFTGRCDLNEGGDGSFTASMRNGPRYQFRSQRGRYWISDSSGGMWPVEYSDYGRGAVFRWADMNLETRQLNYRGSSDRNRNLDTLLRELFN